MWLLAAVGGSEAKQRGSSSWDSALSPARAGFVECQGPVRRHVPEDGEENWEREHREKAKSKVPHDWPKAQVLDC